MRGGGVAGVAAAMALVTVVWSAMVATVAQHAPCYECELFKEEHPDSHPYEEIRSHCTYPCECPPTPACQEGVHLITDGCGCCRVCARQQGDLCDGTHLCDEEKGLVCEYASETATTGTCKAIKGASCQVGNRTYEDGETFSPDCRSQCSCQNGTYGCVSLCGRENVRPSDGCVNPRLVPVPGKCCRDWMCDASAPTAPKCRAVASEWSPCSATCGVGISTRMSNDNEDCMLRNDTRLCQLRPCKYNVEMAHETKHPVRRGHQCKATIHDTLARHVRYGNCTSVRLLHAKYCGLCGDDLCCTPLYTYTRKEEFRCWAPRPSSAPYGRPYTRQSLYVMLIKRCQCRPCNETANNNNNNNDGGDTSNDDPEPWSVGS